MKNPDFKDVLRELIEKNGGLSSSNMERLSDKIRKFKPEFSAAYLRRLLSGLPPSREDRVAISQVLEAASERWMSIHWNVEEVGNRYLAALALQHTKSPVIAAKLVDALLVRVNYRNISLSDDEVHKVFGELYLENMLEVEIDVFQLQEQS